MPSTMLSWFFAFLGMSALVVATLRAMALLRGPEDSIAVAFLRVILLAHLRLLHRYRLLPGGLDPAPHRGPAILIANHRSGLDPAALGIATRRKIRFLMAREYYEVPFLRWAYRMLECIPVNRDGNDLGATKAALGALRAGRVVGVFPQGGIREAGAPLELKPGTALLALRTGAPVIPVHIDGTPSLESVFLALFKPSRTTITAGAPVLLGDAPRDRPSRGEIEAATRRLAEAMEDLARRCSPSSAGGGSG